MFVQTSKIIRNKHLLNELKNLKCCQSQIILTHQEYFLSLILLFPDDMLFVLRLVMTAKSITAYIYCTLWFGYCFFFFLILLFSSDHEFWKAVNFILRHCTVYQSCKYFTSTEKNQTICFVVSQIKNFLLFWWFVEVFCCSKSKSFYFYFLLILILSYYTCL